ncbi:MAG: phosphatidylserine decarboxylase [Phycisphaerales bacterium]|nr:phosphatidylserine decarboxylase [Phycisphaerales bacterium]
MRLAPAGIREWGGSGLMATVVVVVCWGLIPLSWVNWVVTGCMAVLWLSIAWFFRDPHRRPSSSFGIGAMISPADGRVSAIERVEHHEFVDGPAVVVRIFLSVLNVHVNRTPSALEVIRTDYRPGRFLDARTDESAKVNECNLIFCRRDDGVLFGVRQVSGAIARRIVCPVKSGDRLARGIRFGMIKFGSTTELVVPDRQDVVVHVSLGDRVRGAVTLLADVPWRG